MTPNTLFFVGMHNLHHGDRVPAAFISVHRLRRRARAPFPVRKWICDSGAFTTILKHGGYPESPEAYAAEVMRWADNGKLLAVVAQDFMCEPFMIAKTRAPRIVERARRLGLFASSTDSAAAILIHQRWTIRRYDRLRAALPPSIYVMPVLQGFSPASYVEHLRAYGDRVGPGMWIGVGSVCKRNGKPAEIEAVLMAIHAERPDLRLHGFGIKTTALGSDLVRALLFSADSMAWSFAARRQGRDANSPEEAAAFARRIAENRPEPTLLGAMMGIAA